MSVYTGNELWYILGIRNKKSRYTARGFDDWWGGYPRGIGIIKIV